MSQELRIELSRGNSFTSLAAGRVFQKGQVYTMPEAEAVALLSERDTKGVPYFKRVAPGAAASPVVDAAAEKAAKKKSEKAAKIAAGTVTVAPERIKVNIKGPKGGGKQSAKLGEGGDTAGAAAAGGQDDSVKTEETPAAGAGEQGVQV